jgi:7-carboxy-7-deazaguanine synthase
MSRYAVNDLYVAIQGEGVQTGVPMVLLRLHGCGVGCPFCDTRETWHVDPANEVATLAEALGTSERYVWLDADALASYIHTQYPGLRWVLITGGEPADQSLPELVTALHQKGYKTAIETSGTALGHIDAGIDWVCVSPKIGMPGGRLLEAAAISSADEIKMVIGRERDLERLEKLIDLYPLKDSVQICVQPMSQLPKATALCIEAAQQKGYRLSIQLHKVIAQR